MYFRCAPRSFFPVSRSYLNRMIRETKYQAARAVALTVETHFAQHLAQARQGGEQHLGSKPPAQVIEEIVDTTFWASLRREEGRSPKISLAFLSPAQAGLPLLFEKALPFTPAMLTKLAPAVERPGIHLGVWQEAEELVIWGTTRQIPGICFVLEVIEPGLLVIKHRRLDGLGKFVNIAVLKGDQVKVVNERNPNLPDCPRLLTSLLGLEPAPASSDPVNVLVQLAVSMRAHGRGGSLLVVPSGTTAWRASILHPISYSVQPAYSGLADLMRQDPRSRSQPRWQAALRQAIESVAGLTAVDGATVISDQYEVLAFGAKIGRPEGNLPIDQIIVTEPIVGNQAAVIHPAQNGGTRHLSAAQFVNDQRDAFALVASQDGRFTIFGWSPCEKIVHAHRIDALLL
jgi:hypothetical protein